jgi:hypothetical protein
VSVEDLAIDFIKKLIAKQGETKDGVEVGKPKNEKYFAYNDFIVGFDSKISEDNMKLFHNHFFVVAFNNCPLSQNLGDLKEAIIQKCNKILGKPTVSKDHSRKVEQKEERQVTNLKKKIEEIIRYILG